ncbi:protein MKS1 [Brachypodium distachyon]|uniref:VQ domain-containing protein n=1 Tax=Brachypodium distachyon TaxID=15368 RepID=A0A0Q3KRB9_BRADI|nr:protein MKS1 [Brachypodium distachyon]KQJ82573.1 hypothetical protein BRADI_5g09730v3 [Brachypodium distachyon]|eukprot:XP_003579720.1 protein MKS1 [Brachypodium distachyon]
MLNHPHSHSRHGPLSPLLRVLSRAAAAAAGSPSEHHRARQPMDSPSSSGRPTTPRRQLQLQGPRPPRLNVRPESHAIKKPSGAPAQAQAQGRRDQQQQPHGPPPARAPVIIYDASPKIIHTKPSEFLALVQRLTGPSSSAGPFPSEAHAQTQDQDYQMEDAVQLGQSSFLPPELLLSPSAAMSPAARLATIERSVRNPMHTLPASGYVDFSNDRFDDGGLAAVLGGAARPGILSPLPSSLPPAAASGLFSPLPFDASCISWLNELSPILRAASTGAGSSGSGSGGGGGAGNGGIARPPPAYYSDPFVPSPRNLLATPTMPSPATFAELLRNLPDL